MKKFINLRASLFFALSLAGGILVGGFFFSKKLPFSAVFCLLFVLSVTAFLVFEIKHGKMKKGLVFSVCFSLAFIFGLLGISLQLHSFTATDITATTRLVTGRVSTVVSTKNGYSLVLDSVTLDSTKDEKLGYKVVVYGFDLEDEFERGDLVQFTATLRYNSAIYENKISSSNVEKGIKYTAHLDGAKIEKIGTRQTVFDKVHIFIRDSLKAGLSGDAFAVTYALLLGEDGYVNQETLLSFRGAGITHIFAVSGLHVGFFAGVLLFILKKFKVKGWFKIFIVFVSITFYSGVCGFSASSIRATIMCVVGLFAQKFALKYDGLSSMGVAGSLILLVSPIQLFCAGFQLSFIVVFGILIGSRPLSKALGFLPNKISNFLAPVLCAQAFSLPACLWNFGEVSLFSVLANILLLPIIGVVYVSTLLGAIVGGLFSICKVALFLQGLVLEVMVFVVGFIDYTPFFLVGVSLGVFSLLYYAGLLVASGFFNLNKLYRRVISLILVLIALFCGVFNTLEYRKQARVYVIGSPSICATFVHASDTNALIVSNVQDGFSLSRLNRIKRSERIDQIDYLIIVDSGKMINLFSLVIGVSQVFEVCKLVYVGEERRWEELDVLSISPRTKIFNILPNEELPVKDFNASYLLDGRGVEVKVYGREILILSELDKIPSSSQIRSGQDVVVATNYLEQVFYLSNAKTKISYLSSQWCLDAENQGNLIFSYKNNKK